MLLVFLISNNRENLKDYNKDTHAGQTKKSLKQLLAQGSWKMAATYSPTGVQYHRRGRA